jgi:hypothetical protein
MNLRTPPSLLVAGSTPSHLRPTVWLWLCLVWSIGVATAARITAVQLGVVAGATSTPIVPLLSLSQQGRFVLQTSPSTIEVAQCRCLVAYVLGSLSNDGHVSVSDRRLDADAHNSGFYLGSGCVGLDMVVMGSPQFGAYSGRATVYAITSQGTFGANATVEGAPNTGFGAFVAADSGLVAVQAASYSITFYKAKVVDREVKLMPAAVFSGHLGELVYFMISHR